MNEENMGAVVDGLEDIEVANTSIEEIDAENINLIFIGIDESYSMVKFTGDMQHSLTEFKAALEDSKEADEILLARANFADSIDIGGYKRISQFDTSFSADGCTALYDTIVEGKKKLMDYREFLRNEGMRVKAVFAIFSDGEDTASNSRFAEAKEAIEDLNSKEITTAFISFGGAADKEATGLKFRNILNVASSASELRKAFNCLSKSVIESSKSVVDDGDDFFKVD